MLYRICKLSFYTPVRFGEGLSGACTPTFRADTLFSAMYLALQPEGQADRLLEMAKAGRILLSDAFPYDGEHLFLPKPAGMESGRLKAMEDPSVLKQVKRIEWIPSGRMKEWLSGRLPLEQLQFSFGIEVSRTRVNRRGEEPLPYEVEGFRFREGCGLYVILCTKDEDCLDFAQEALRLLEAGGIGGKVSSGWGKFTLEMREPPEEIRKGLMDENSSAQLLLSSAFPDAAEGDRALSGARYALVRRGGFTADTSEKPAKKRSTYLFSSGSVFASRFSGTVTDVATVSSHPVWRYAKALMMGVN